MAKILPSQGKIVDVIVQITDDRALITCRDCECEMNTRSVITTFSVDKPNAIAMVHNLICPECGGVMYMHIRSQA